MVNTMLKHSKKLTFKTPYLPQIARLLHTGFPQKKEWRYQRHNLSHDAEFWWLKEILDALYGKSDVTTLGAHEIMLAVCWVCIVVLGPFRAKFYLCSIRHQDIYHIPILPHPALCSWCAQSLHWYNFQWQRSRVDCELGFNTPPGHLAYVFEAI